MQKPSSGSTYLDFAGASVVKNLCANVGRHGFHPWVEKIPLDMGKGTHSSILAWEISWREEPGGLKSIGWQRLCHKLVTRQQKI